VLKLRLSLSVSVTFIWAMLTAWLDPPMSPQLSLQIEEYIETS